MVLELAEPLSTALQHITYEWQNHNKINKNSQEKISSILSDSLAIFQVTEGRQVLPVCGEMPLHPTGR